MEKLVDIYTTLSYLSRFSPRCFSDHVAGGVVSGKDDLSSYSQASIVLFTELSDEETIEDIAKKVPLLLQSLWFSI